MIIGVNERGEKHLLAVEDGVRESIQSWREVLLDLKRCGLAEAPKLAMIFKLGTCAQARRRRLRGFDKVAKVIRDVRFVDGIEQHQDADQTRNAA